MTGRSAKWLLIAGMVWAMPGFAQHGGRGQGPGGGGGGAPGGPGGPGGMPGGPGARSGGPGGVPGGDTRGQIPQSGAGDVPGHLGRTGGSGRGAQLGPAERWWDDKNFARSLNLRADQKQRMDAVFQANRSELMGRYQELKAQESRLEETTRDTKVNHGSVFAQIDRVAQAREALGTVNTRMTEALRKELDADQIQKLQEMNR